MLWNHLDVPGFKSDPQQVVLCVAQVEVSKFLELSVDVSSGEALCEVGNPEADLPHIKITNTVKGISRWGEWAAGQGEIALTLITLLQKKKELLDYTAHPGGQDDLIADVPLDSLIGLKGQASVEVYGPSE